MPSNYNGLPAAASVEQSIVLAQLLILRDLERRAQQIKNDEGAANGPQQTDRKAA